MAKIDLSIIIPSFNTRSVILDCLDSIIKYTKDLNYEIIVVENGSKDGSNDTLRNYSKTHSRLTLVDAKENLGFGKANNLGVRYSKGEYLLFLNSDTLLFDNALKISLDSAKKKADLGVYSCRLLNKNLSTQQTGGYFPTLFRIFAWQLFIDDLPLVGKFVPSIHPQKSAYDTDQKMDWVTGAFMIIPKKVFDEVGGFDEKIFMYTEEMELIYRLYQKGYRCYYEKEPSIIHLGGASGGSFLALTSEIKNMIYFWKKHMPLWQLPIVKCLFFTGSLLRWLLFGIIKQDETRRRAYASALRNPI